MTYRPIISFASPFIAVLVASWVGASIGLVLLPDTPEVGVALGVAAVGGAFALVSGWYTRRKFYRAVAALAALAKGKRAVSDGASLRNFHPVLEVRLVAEAIEAMHQTHQRELTNTSGFHEALAEILSAIRDAIVAVGQDGRFIYVNRSAKEMFGIRDDGAGSIMTHLREPGIIEAFRRVKAKKEHERFEEGDEDSRLLLIDATPAVFPEGELGVVLVARDVTDLRRLERVRRDFVANVSHELKTPLTSIQGYVDTLLDDEDSPDADPKMRRVFLKKIERNAERLRNLTNDLLTLARLERTGEAGMPEVYRPDRHIRSAFEALHDKARAKEIAISFEPACPAVSITGDAKAFEQAFYNLIDNAINYTPPGGQVRVRTWFEKGNFCGSVADSGIGIAESEQGRVFERFYRVDKARSRDVGGTGLGLAIVRHAAQIHGGQVALTSRLGEGSEFTLTIPAAAADRP